MRNAQGYIEGTEQGGTQPFVVIQDEDTGEYKRCADDGFIHWTFQCHGVKPEGSILQVYFNTMERPISVPAPVSAPPKLKLKLKEHHAGRDDLSGGTWSGWLTLTPGPYDITVRAGIFVDAVCLQGVKWGGDGGTEHTWSLEPGERIVGISGRAGYIVDRLSFRTSSKDEYTPPVGGGGGTRFSFDEQQVGRIHKVGFITGPYGKLANVVHQVAILSEK